jgi:hypothetical protein
MNEQAPVAMSGLHLEIWKPGFKRELTALIRKYGFERDADTPAQLLADYFLICLNGFEALTTQRASYKRIGWQADTIPPEERP